ncbi:HIT family protein, partial [Lactobacillus jensenii]|uniref:HIT family protein n=1 Tax=Lactobacillus jensenii TaxID=109790 RepID=UPI0028700610
MSDLDDNCLFCKIIKGEIPSYKLFENDDVYAFLDISHVNPGHTLLVPKKHIVNLFDYSQE